MAASQKQIAANKKNAQKSTGPVTAIGKAKVSVNAVSHGVLSSKLILPGESEEEYLQLYDEMVSSIQPKGALELSVVEKIAINLWKQRRLNNAETAEINLNSRSKRIAYSVNNDLGNPSLQVTAGELDENDQAYLDWCDVISSELAQIRNNKNTPGTNLKTVAPTIYEELEKDSKKDNLSIDEYLKDFGGLNEYLSWFQDHSVKYKRRADVLELSELERTKSSILHGETEKRYSRYQVTINNEFHRLVKTLHDMKKMRSIFIEGEVVTVNVNKK